MTGAERLLAACASRPVDASPVWFMRQSGGSLAAYRALRHRHSVLEIAHTPALAAEVALEAQRAIGTDGAVLFADIMLPVEAMGVVLELTSAGPCLERPIRSDTDVDRLRPVNVEADLGFVLEAVRRIRADLDGAAAVIGLAGGPFTVAAYCIEGGPSRDLLAARRLAVTQPALWARLMDLITGVNCAYVQAQVRAGAQVIQLFDSWAGVLAPEDYDAWVAPWSRRVLRSIRHAGVPAIHFVAAGANLLERLAIDADVVSLDAAQPFDLARARLGSTAVQGNLDPARLSGDRATVRDAVERLLRANDGRPGHIVNTGHAVPADTPTARLAEIVDLVHDRTAALAIAGSGGIA